MVPPSPHSATAGIPDARDPLRLPETIVDGGSGAVYAVAAAYVALLRRRHPGASPAQILHVMDKQFLMVAALGGTGTGIATGRVRTAGPLLGLSAAHVGLTASFAAVYLFGRAQIYALGVEEARRLVVSCTFGSGSHGILEQQFAGTWWRSATAYLPVSQVRLYQRVANRSLQRVARKRSISRSAKLLPTGIGSAIGFGAGRIFANRVIDAATSQLGRPPLTFE